MKSTSVLAVLVVFGLVATVVADDSKKVSLGLELAKGQKVSYSVSRTSETKFERDGETFEFSTSSKLNVTVEIKETGDAGAKAALSFGKVTSSVKGRDRGFDFDSGSDDGDGEIVAELKKIARGTHEIEIEKTGAPGRLEFLGERPSRGRGRFGGPSVFGVYGSLQRDLGQIFGAGLHDEALEVGKVYRPRGGDRRPGDGQRRGGQRGRRPDADAGRGGREIALQDQDRRRRRGGFGRRGSSLRFEGSEDGEAKFTVLRAPFGRPGNDAEPEPVKIGVATYSLKDGLLIRLALEEKSPEDARFQRSSKTVIERTGHAAAPKPKPKPEAKKKVESL